MACELAADDEAQPPAQRGKLYVEAISVKERAKRVLKKLAKESLEEASEPSAAQVETSSGKDSAAGWRLEPAPLKKMRCVLHGL